MPGQGWASFQVSWLAPWRLPSRDPWELEGTAVAKLGPPAGALVGQSVCLPTGARPAGLPDLRGVSQVAARPMLTCPCLGEQPGRKALAPSSLI